MDDAHDGTTTFVCEVCLVGHQVHQNQQRPRGGLFVESTSGERRWYLCSLACLRAKIAAL